MKKIYLTKERLEELKKELSHFILKKREEVAERLKHAKGHGDLSENSEYFQAKEEQERVEGRIAELEGMIRNAEIIKKSAGDVVKVGSTVVLKKSGNDGDFRYTIVGSNEARPESGLISNESPLGRAFLNKKIGDSVVVETPKGKSEYSIIAID